MDLATVLTTQTHACQREIVRSAEVVEAVSERGREIEKEKPSLCILVGQFNQP